MLTTANHNRMQYEIRVFEFKAISVVLLRTCFYIVLQFGLDGFLTAWVRWMNANAAFTLPFDYTFNFKIITFTENEINIYFQLNISSPGIIDTDVWYVEIINGK